ncbi:MAG TPA: hypothetical protein VFH88_02060 [Candidatus Krumholzibacteria bacterium]|nr:hypothetical protein [Candidatus Krumholzibacteria bacterium]
MKLSGCFLCVLAGAFLAACSNDSITSAGPYTPPTLHATLQSLDRDFNAVCGAGPNDLYLAGVALLRNHGASWQPVVLPPLFRNEFRHAIGFPTGEVILDDGYSMFELKDGRWFQFVLPPGYIRASWARAPDDVYIATTFQAYHFDGLSWTKLPLSDDKYLNCIAGNQAGHVVLGGDRGYIAIYDGNTWSETSLDSTAYVSSVAMTESGTAFATDYPQIFSIVGNTHTSISDEYNYEPDLRADGDRLYSFGSYSDCNTYVNRIRMYDGTWHDVLTTPQSISDLWVGRGEIIAFGRDGFLWRGTASGGDEQSPPYPARGPLVDVAEIDGAIYAVGEGAFRYEAGSWTDLNKEYITRSLADGVSGLNRNDIYAVGYQMILHYDGRAWSWVNGGLDARLEAVWEAPNGHVIAVGNGIVEFDGLRWSRTELPIGALALYDVWGAGGTVVAVGFNGLAVKKTSQGWEKMSTNTDEAMYSLWGWDEQHIYAATSASNQIMFYNGATWRPVIINGVDAGDPSSIWGTSPSNLFVLNRSGRLVHFDGRGWTNEECILGSMGRICGSGTSNLLAVGYGGAVAYSR